VHSVRMRLIAFVLSAALVGAGGGLYAQFLGILTVDTFYLSLSFITIAMLVVGGIGSLTGAVSGVIVVTVIVQFLRYCEHGVTIGSTELKLPDSTSELGLGVLLALILVFRPNGVSGGKELRLIGASKGLPPETVSEAGSTLESNANAVASETLS
jgi:branched-chain amino acid transport system permease protein